MDDLSQINSNNCADLERLAAAAATMGYSSDPATTLATSQMIDVSGNMATNALLVPTTAVMSPHYATETYDLSRYTVVFEPSKSNCNSIATSSLNTSRGQDSTSALHRLIGPPSHYTVLERTDIATQTNERHPQNISIAPTAIHYIDVRNNVVDSSITQPPTNTLQMVSAGQVLQFVQQEVTPPVVVSSGNFEESDTQQGSSELEKKQKKVKKKNVSQENLNSSKKEEKNKKLLDEVPEPIDIDGKKFFVCKLCNAKFIRKYLFKRHQITHTGEKRGALSLETKAAIINRIKNGEKQVDLAMEYNVGRSTLSFIMKNSEKFLDVLKVGKFLPNSKRLRGAHREDVEEALYQWYKQAINLKMKISGPILCKKAKDFALKLGYHDFKATHGWLDRFKHRKQIILGRSKNAKDKEPPEEDTEEFKEDFAYSILPNNLIEFDANDVFCAQEVGILYKMLPDAAQHIKGTRCAGGKQSSQRLTVLLCTNMTGSEKFPLLVIGKNPKPKCFKNIKSLPVQYLADDQSWMTKEKFTAWLNDLNSWFVLQNRKIILFIPNLSIHPKAMKLSAVKLVLTPFNFVGPITLGISHALKRNYRRGLLEVISTRLNNGTKLRKRGFKEELKFSLLTCLHNLAVAWHAVTDITIANSFQRSGMGKYSLGGWNATCQSETILGTENLDLLHRLKSSGMNIDDSFTFDDYISFDDEVQVCHVMNDDDIIASVSGIDVAESSDSDNNQEEDEERTKENVETMKENVCPTFAEAERNLNVLRSHIAKHPRTSQETVNLFSYLEHLIQKSANSPNVQEENELGIPENQTINES